jgi:hypothetical protein
MVGCVPADTGGVNAMAKKGSVFWFFYPCETASSEMNTDHTYPNDVISTLPHRLGCQVKAGYRACAATLLAVTLLCSSTH